MSLEKKNPQSAKQSIPRVGNMQETEKKKERKKIIRSFPRIADPNICHRLRCQISPLINHVLRQLPFLRLILILRHRISPNESSLPTSSAESIPAPQNQSQRRRKQNSVKLTCSTKMLNFVAAPPPIFFRAVSTSFCNSVTAYSNVVRVSSTSSTMRIFLPTRFDISSADRSSHCVRVILVPGVSVGSAGSREGRDS